MFDWLKQNFMSGGAGDIRNMAMASGMGRLSMGALPADPLRALASKVGGQGLNQLMNVLKQPRDIEARAGMGGPLSRAGTPMIQAAGAGIGSPQGMPMQPQPNYDQLRRQSPIPQPSQPMGPQAGGLGALMHALSNAPRPQMPQIPRQMVQSTYNPALEQYLMSL